MGVQVIHLQVIQLLITAIKIQRTFSGLCNALKRKAKVLLITAALAVLCSSAAVAQTNNAARILPSISLLLLDERPTTIELVTGAETRCFLERGRLKCWGFDVPGIPSDSNFSAYGPSDSAVDVSAELSADILALDLGEDAGCVVRVSGSVFCWGDNDDVFENKGLLGTGSLEEIITAERVQSINNAVDVAVGDEHVCALLRDDSVWCWGSNINRELGLDLTIEFSANPVKIADLEKVTQLEAGSTHSCALLENGTIKCWGRGSLLGDFQGAQNSLVVQVEGITNATQLSVGSRHSCALLLDGGVKCWGRNIINDGDAPRLGDPDFTETVAFTPRAVVNISDATSIVAGTHSSCARLENGAVQCWGSNIFGELGNGTVREPATSPVNVLGLVGTKAISTSGELGFCALLNTDSVSCWGNGFNSAAGSASGLPICISGIAPNCERPRPDFNGDGFDDLAIGAPKASFGESDSVGQVHVLYGADQGLAQEERQIWRISGGEADDGATLGALVGAEDFPNFTRNFGAAVTAGDFNADGYSDLVITDQESNTENGGGVHVLYGSANGLTHTGNQRWSQAGGEVDLLGDDNITFIGDVQGSPESGDQFGAALATGDFNEDGYDDLAVGVPNEDIGSGIDRIESVGSVQILYGSANGLTHLGNEFWHQDSAKKRADDGTLTELGDLIGSIEQGDEFGRALAAHDFNGDGRDDLAIGIPFEEIGSTELAGAVQVLLGTNEGLTPLRHQFWTSQSLRVDVEGDGTADVTEGSDLGIPQFTFYGQSLATADFNNDGLGDLLIGAPGFSSDGVSASGKVQVLYGARASGFISGLRRNGLQNLKQSQFTGGVSGVFDRFGSTLAAGDINGDGFSDVVIAAPTEGISGGENKLGAVTVAFGSENGVSETGGQYLSPVSSLDANNQPMDGLLGGLTGSPEFGSSLSVLDTNGDNLLDVAVGSPFHTSGTDNSEIGSVHLFPATGSGVRTSKHQFWTVEGGLEGNVNEASSIAEPWSDSEDLEFGADLAQ